MKNLNFSIILFAKVILLYNCSNVYKNSDNSTSKNTEVDALFQQIVARLNQDTTAYFTCNKLFEKYEIDTKLNDHDLKNFYDFYYASYNDGNAFARLINIDSLRFFFKEKQATTKDSIISISEFMYIVSNYNNYNTDENLGGTDEQLYYFLEYIEKGFILPQTD